MFGNKLKKGFDSVFCDIFYNKKVILKYIYIYIYHFSKIILINFLYFKKFIKHPNYIYILRLNSFQNNGL